MTREYDDSETNPLYPAMCYRITGTEDFQQVAWFTDSGGYDWIDWVCWWSPSKRRYFIASGSGCSCNSLSDDYGDVSDFEAVATKEAAKESLGRFIDDQYEYRELRNRPRMDDEFAAINKFKEMTA